MGIGYLYYLFPFPSALATLHLTRRMSCRSESAQTGGDDREHIFEQCFSHNLHGKIVSRSKSEKNMTKSAPQPSVYDKMIEDTLLAHSPLQPGTGTGSFRIADVPYGNIRMSQPSLDDDCLAASTKAKNTILQDYNEKFGGNSS